MHHPKPEAGPASAAGGACRERSRWRRSSSTTANRTNGRNLAAILRDPLVTRHFHLGDGKLLQPRQSIERDRHAGVAQSGEREGKSVCRWPLPPTGQSSRSTAWSRASLTTLARCAKPSTSRISATFPSPMMLEPAKSLHGLQLLAQRLHHDLFGVIDLIDHQPETAGRRPAKQRC